MSLLLRLTRKHDDDDLIESLHNYFERPVREELMKHYSELVDDHEIMLDIQCYALNTLPAKYIRHDVDMSFFLSSSQEVALSNMIRFAVCFAYIKIKGNEENLFYQLERCYIPAIITNERKDVLFVNTALHIYFDNWDHYVDNLAFFIDDLTFHENYCHHEAHSVVDIKLADYALADKMVKIKMMGRTFNAASVLMFPNSGISITLLMPCI